MPSPAHAQESLADIAARLAGYDPKALRVELAQQFIRSLLQRPQTLETVGLREARGRVLAADVISR